MTILFLVGLTALLAFISFATYRTSQLLRTWQPDENLLLLRAETIVRLLLIGVAIALGLISGQSPAELGWIPVQPIRDLVAGSILGIGISLALFFPSLLVRRYRPEWYNNVVIESIRPRDRGQWPLVILALIPVALLEEMLFRSLLLGGLAPHVNIIYFAIAASIWFGLLHLPQGEWGVIGVTLVGLLLSFLFLGSQSLLLVVVTHWVANVMQLIIASRQESGAGNG